MNLPSIKTLSSITIGRAKELRRVLEIKDRATLESILDKYPVTAKWYHSCYNPMGFTTAKLSIANEILGTYGVEYIPKGHNSKSPAIEYCNAGDTYNSTLLFVSGRYRVGCWGDIVERGQYD
jgi:hypothetical protein